jgi:type VII secretion-associated serine protease mycosin
MINSGRVSIVPVLSAILILFQPAAASADAVRGAEWYLAYLRVAEAQGISKGKGVTVAVIDTGVNVRQPELSGNVLAGTDEFPGATGDGRQDDDGHGTAMASLIVAHGNATNTGAMGIAPDAKVLPVRVARGGNLSPEDVRKAIAWAVEHGAKVVCIALAGAPSDQWKGALDRAFASDVIVVAGVGNRTEGFRQVAWPAAYPGVVAAAGVDRKGQHADLSVTGPEVTLAAPAVDIVTPGRGGKYVTGSGTSAATAIIAGAAALVRAKFPNMSAAEVVHRLEATAIDAGPPGRDDEYGYGIVNLVGALKADVPPLQPSASPSSSAPAPPTSAAAAPERKSDFLPLTGVLLGLLLASGAVGAVVVAHRRRSSA